MAKTKKKETKSTEPTPEMIKELIQGMTLNKDQVLLIKSKSPFSYADLTVLDEVVRDRCAGLFVIPQWLDFDLVTPKVVEEVFLSKIEIFREHGGKRSEEMEFKSPSDGKKNETRKLELSVDGEEIEILVDGKSLGTYHRNFLKALMLLVLLF